MTASAYGRLTPRMAWQLAAPHTWPAAILPVLVAAAAAAVTSFSISATMVCVLLVICVLMQSAVNTFNDYYDYVKGADSADDNVDPTDAVLVYNNVNPRAALALGSRSPSARRAPSSWCCTRRARRPSRTCPSASWSAGS